MKKLLLLTALIPGLGQAQQRDMQNMNMSKSADTGSGKRVEYFLNITDTMVTFAKGKSKRAIAISGTIKAPTLYLTDVDTAIMHRRNLMNVETSVHRHGLLMPNVADGVPYLNTRPIIPDSTFTYLFPIIQNGTSGIILI